MNSTRSLPLRFLLPSWTARQLSHQLGRRCYKSEGTAVGKDEKPDAHESHETREELNNGIKAVQTEQAEDPQQAGAKINYVLFDDPPYVLAASSKFSAIREKINRRVGSYEPEGTAVGKDEKPDAHESHETREELNNGIKAVQTEQAEDPQQDGAKINYVHCIGPRLVIRPLVIKRHVSFDDQPYVLAASSHKFSAIGEKINRRVGSYKPEGTAVGKDEKPDAHESHETREKRISKLPREEVAHCWHPQRPLKELNNGIKAVQTEHAEDPQQDGAKINYVHSTGPPLVIKRLPLVGPELFGTFSPRLVKGESAGRTGLPLVGPESFGTFSPRLVKGESAGRTSKDSIQEPRMQFFQSNPLVEKEKGIPHCESSPLVERNTKQKDTALESRQSSPWVEKEKGTPCSGSSPVVKKNKQSKITHQSKENIAVDVTRKEIARTRNEKSQLPEVVGPMVHEVPPSLRVPGQSVQEKKGIIAGWLDWITKNSATFFEAEKPEEAKSISVPSSSSFRQEEQKPDKAKTESKSEATAETKKVPSTSGPSIFEELFPEEIQKEIAAQKKQTPWFPFPKIVTGDNGVPSLNEIRQISTKYTPPIQEKPKSNWQDQAPQTRAPNVLILSRVTGTLVESDFMRVSPQGSHIEGWASGITKIIPGRNPRNLVLTGHYFLFFRNSETARAYKDTMVNYHRLSSNHTPRSLSSPIAPPKATLTSNGLKPEEVVNFFTILPASQAGISINEPYSHYRPIRPAVQRIINEGGYRPILQAENTGSVTGKAGVVKLSIVPRVEGTSSAHGIQAFITRDGLARNLAWKLTKSEHVISPLDDIEGIENGYDSNAEPGERLRMRSHVVKWIVAFQDVAEARRFVRVWHKREWPDYEKRWRRSKKDRGREMELADLEPATVNAELLW